MKKLATAIKLDTNMAQILSGEFIYDALLQRAEQLAKQEVTNVLSLTALLPWNICVDTSIS